MTYLRALGQTLGLAIVGAVVNNTLADELARRLPASTVKQLTSQGLKFATNTQVLVNPTYRDTVVHTSEGFAVRSAVAQATAHVPPGPRHDQTVATITRQVTAQAIQQTQHLLNQVFDALRLSLAVTIQHSFVTVLIFCAGVLLAALFLKDVPLAKQFRDEAGTGGEESKADTSASVM